MLENCILLGTLGFHSIEDIKRKQITVMVTLCSAIAGLLCHMVYHNHSIYNILGGILVGGMIFLFSFLSQGKIGQGDGMILMLTGLYLGVEENLSLMFLSFLLAAVWAVIAVLFLHYGKRDKIPFVPFLFLAYLVILFI